MTYINGRGMNDMVKVKSLIETRPLPRTSFTCASQAGGRIQGPPRHRHGIREVFSMRRCTCNSRPIWRRCGSRQGASGFWKRRSLKLWLATDMTMSLLPIFPCSVSGYDDGLMRYHRGREYCPPIHMKDVRSDNGGLIQKWITGDP